MNNTYGIARVGLTPGIDDNGAQYFPQGYVEAIEAVGAEVVPMMFDIPLDTLYPLVISLDAMVFSGGGDIDPVHYGQARSEACGPADARRDRFELALADLVVGRGDTGSGHLPGNAASQRGAGRNAEAKHRGAPPGGRRPPRGLARARERGFSKSRRERACALTAITISASTAWPTACA